MVYIRKIDSDAWINRQKDDSDSISDLATKNHELSVWKVSDDLSDIDDIALALAMTRDNTEGVMVVILDPAEIEEHTGFRVNIEDQEGQSLYLAKNRDHKNFMLYTLSDMGKLAEYIHSLLKEEREDSFRFYDEQTLTKILNNKFQTGEFDSNTVKDKGKWNKKFKEYKKGITSHN